MSAIKTKNITDAFFQLQMGKTIQPVGSNGIMWMGFGVIYWRNYGQSANKANKRELRWIFRVIFKSKTYDFIVL